MPVSARLASDLAASGVLRGVRIACSLIVEPKTAVLVERLSEAGAMVGVYCHAHDCDQRMADEIAARGYAIAANASGPPPRSGLAHSGSSMTCSRTSSSTTARTSRASS